MARKIITARDILAQKNYVEKKFDTDGFLNAVATFFSSHDVSEILLITPLRFASMENAPECGYIDRTAEDYWEKALEEGRVDWLEFVCARNRGLAGPSFAIDEPFCKNAIFLLRTMAGYVVKKGRQGRFWVSLV